jgi:hypothetical protein
MKSKGTPARFPSGSRAVTFSQIAKYFEKVRLVLCGKCGKETVVIGYESAEQLDVEPTKLLCAGNQTREAAILSILETCRRLKVPVRDYQASILPGLANFPIDRVALKAKFRS